MDRFHELMRSDEGLAPCATEGCALWENHRGACTVAPEPDTECYHERADADRRCYGCGVRV